MCAHTADLKIARWLLPAYLGLFSVVVIPVVALGTIDGLTLHTASDSLILTLPMSYGAPWLTVLVFLGGLSAATAMVVVASTALATMISNDIAAPLLWRQRLEDGASLGRRVLWVRRAVIVSLALLAFAYYRCTTGSISLAAIGMLAFAAVAQFAPALFAALYWSGASRAACSGACSAGSSPGVTFCSCRISRRNRGIVALAEYANVGADRAARAAGAVAERRGDAHRVGAARRDLAGAIGGTGLRGAQAARGRAAGDQLQGGRSRDRRVRGSSAPPPPPRRCANTSPNRTRTAQAGRSLPIGAWCSMSSARSRPPSAPPPRASCSRTRCSARASKSTKSPSCSMRPRRSCASAASCCRRPWKT
jgi:hypothetical protein